MEYIEFLNLENNSRLKLIHKPMKSFFQKLRGVIGRKSIKGECYSFDRTNSIHTFFCSQPIDILFIDREDRVAAYYNAFKPWRLIPYVSRAVAVYEAPAGIFENMGFKKNTMVRISKVPEHKNR